MRVRNIATLILLIFSGCTTPATTLSRELRDELNTPLYCEGEDECKVMWERASFFVNTNAGFKIQIHNDTLIETYNPTDYSTRLAYSISKEPLGDGRYQIWTIAWCASMSGCTPHYNEGIARAKQYIRTGKK